MVRTERIVKRVCEVWVTAERVKFMKLLYRLRERYLSYLWDQSIDGGQLIRHRRVWEAARIGSLVDWIVTKFLQPQQRRRSFVLRG